MSTFIDIYLGNSTRPLNVDFSRLQHVQYLGPSCRLLSTSALKELTSCLRTTRYFTTNLSTTGFCDAWEIPHPSTPLSYRPRRLRRLEPPSPPYGRRSIRDRGTRPPNVRVGGTPMASSPPPKLSYVFELLGGFCHFTAIILIA